MCSGCPAPTAKPELASPAVDGPRRRCDARSHTSREGAMKAVVGALALAAAMMSPAAQAETPASTLVMAMNIDDIISLDPAETFELQGGEVNANVYDRVTVYEPGEVALSGGVAES